jgi:hypothetical protein
MSEPRKSAIFIHAAALGRIAERLAYFFRLIHSSELYNNVDKIYLCYVGNTGAFPFHIIGCADPDNKVVLKQVSTDLGAFELPTQCELYKFCCENPNYNVLYLHTKGIFREENQCIEDWVNYMTHFCVNKWQLCAETLQTSRSCGVDLREWPVWHYSGNFWWGRADHIASLPAPLEFADLNKYPNPLGSARHNQEFWICYGSNGGEGHKGLWESGIHCFERHLHMYPLASYNTIKDN